MSRMRTSLETGTPKNDHESVDARYVPLIVDQKDINEKIVDWFEVK